MNREGQNATFGIIKEPLDISLTIVNFFCLWRRFNNLVFRREVLFDNEISWGGVLDGQVQDDVFASG